MLFFFRSLVATWLPFNVRTHITWTFLSLVGLTTFLTGLRLDPKKLDTSQAVEDVVEDTHDHASDTNSERTISQRC